MFIFLSNLLSNLLVFRNTTLLEAVSDVFNYLLYNTYGTNVRSHENNFSSFLM